VTLGRDFGAEIEVTQGLDGRERLVENPTDDLENGQIVRLEGPSENGGKLASTDKNR
jgi:hypothetical protein